MPVRRSYFSRMAGRSEKSSSGFTPWQTKFIASVTTSTLPVRSPFPNKVPSTRSAPASTPNSASQIPVPRSLWGCTESTTASRYFICLCMYSICPAKICGIATCTVEGRLIIALCPTVGCHTSSTALQTSEAYSTSVCEKLSGLYSNRISPPSCAASSLRSLAPSTASFLISSRSFLNTCSRWIFEVEL